MSDRIGMFEVQLSTKNEGRDWRNNHTIFVLTTSAERAIAVAKDRFPCDPIIHQVIQRNRFGSLLVVDEEVMR